MVGHPERQEKEMTVAHIEIGSGYPWIDEFLGHPHEYWPVYLLVAGVLSTLVYLVVAVRRLQRAE